MAMRIDVFSLFPAALEGFLDASLIGKARRAGLVELLIHDLRAGALDAHRSVDDAPFGGGPGMVLAPDPVFRVVEAVAPPRPLYLLSPGGRRFDQQLARVLAGAGDPGPARARSRRTGFSLLCGRYEGVDQRIADHLCDGELSIGDYVLAGGEVAALAVVETVVRLIPGVMGNDASAAEESFSEGLLEYPHYTRPATYRGWEVPAVLRSGDHAVVARWRRAAALRRTVARRPDLISARGGLDTSERGVLEEFGGFTYPREPSRGRDRPSPAARRTDEEPDAP